MSKLAVLRNYRYRRFLRGLWIDSPDTVESGWTDNGDGSYTCDGTNGANVRQSTDAGALKDDATYEVTFTISAYTSGGFRILLSGDDDIAIGTTRSALGTYTENVTIDTVIVAPTDEIRLQSITSFNGTVRDVKIREVERV